MSVPVLLSLVVALRGWSQYRRRRVESRALRTGSELLLVGEVIVVELDGLLLLLLVVDGVCTGCGVLSALTPLQFAQRLWRSPPCPEGILKKSVVLVVRSSVCRWEGGGIWSGVENVRRSRVGKGLDARKSGMSTATELWLVRHVTNHVLVTELGKLELISALMRLI